MLRPGSRFGLDSVGWSPGLVVELGRVVSINPAAQLSLCPSSGSQRVGRTCTGKLVPPAGINLSESRVRGYGQLGGHYLIIENLNQLNTVT
jgi:hypothetical protein